LEAPTAGFRVKHAEVVTVVAVAHDDIPAARGLDAANQRRAITARRDIDDTCTAPNGDLLRAVGAAVIGDQHLPGDAAARKI